MIEHIKEAEGVPPAIGPYSLAISIQGQGGRTVKCSGQLPLTPDGQVVGGGIETQTGQVIENVENVLAAARAELKHVVDVMIAVSDMNNFAAVNEVYEQRFTGDQPVRAVIESPHLPKGVLVEMKAEAFVPDDKSAG